MSALLKCPSIKSGIQVRVEVIRCQIDISLYFGFFLCNFMVKLCNEFTVAPSLCSGGPHVHGASAPCPGAPRCPRIFPALGPLFLLPGPAYLQPQAAGGEDQVDRHQHPGRRHLRNPGRGFGLPGALSAWNQRQSGGHRVARDRGG